MMSEKRQLPEAVYPDPRTLYIRDEWPRESWARHYSAPVGGAAFGVVSVLGYNYYKDRPFRAGIQRYIICGIIGGTVGYYLKQKIADYYAFRDQIFRHYIATHPQDFPPPERKKVGEEWYPWVPVR